MSELPFPLDKRHKYFTRKNWEKIGIIFRDNGHFEFVYYEYIRATNCELCNKLFPNTRDRQLDHDHISKCKDKNYKTGQCFRIIIVRDKTNILATKRKSLEEAIKCRDEFLAAHPEIYT